MSKMSYEQRMFMDDCREKKQTARSARHKRTHCGKGGNITFPSDHMTKKEKKAMNGECKTYRMNEPMTWNEFKALPDDLKVKYIKTLREKFNVPDKAIAEMFGIGRNTLSLYFTKCGLSSGKSSSASKRYWDEKDFTIWRNRVIETDAVMTKDDIEKIMVKDDAPNVGETDHSCKLAVPNSGTLTFEGEADNIMNSMKDILRNRYVRLNVQWTVTDGPSELTVTMDTAGLAKAATVIDYAVLNAQRKATLGTKG